MVVAEDEEEVEEEEEEEKEEEEAFSGFSSQGTRHSEAITPSCTQFLCTCSKDIDSQEFRV